MQAMLAQCCDLQYWQHKYKYNYQHYWDWWWGRGGPHWIYEIALTTLYILRSAHSYLTFRMARGAERQTSQSWSPNKSFLHKQNYNGKNYTVLHVEHHLLMSALTVGKAVDSEPGGTCIWLLWLGKSTLKSVLPCLL